jgi:hypothetical protein
VVQRPHLLDMEVMPTVTASLTASDQAHLGKKTGNISSPLLYNGFYACPVSDDFCLGVPQVVLSGMPSIRLQSQ